MTHHRVRLLVFLTATFFIASCRGEKKPANPDSVAAVLPPIVPAVPAAVNTGWDPAQAGPMMLLSSPDAMTRAHVVLPTMTDSSLSSTSAFQLDSLAGLPVDLFDRPGAAGSATLRIDPQTRATETCPSWPVAWLENVKRSWRVGFVRGIAKSLPLDSLENATSADSLLMTTELARLASVLSVASDPAFQGLPFAVRKAYRFTAGATTAIVGDVVRKINEEANPREEHLLLIAERVSPGSGGYVTAFYSRAAGSEEAVRTNEILSAVRFVRNATLAIIVSFDYEDGGRVALIERTGNHSWKVTWRSAYTGC